MVFELLGWVDGWRIKYNTMKKERLSINGLIKALESKGLTDKDGKYKQVCFDFGSAIPTTIDSHRGDYSIPALGYELSSYDGNGDYSKCTSDKVIEMLKESIGSIREGWKGGTYRMDGDDQLWVANRGNSGHTGIVGVKGLYGSYLVICTKFFKD